MLVLSRRDLERLLSPAGVIAALESAFREYAGGSCRMLPRQALTVPPDGHFLVMTSALLESRALGTKLITVQGKNRERGLPTIFASYLLLDLETGAPLALMEAGFLTGIRTGAASALAARFLARPDSRRVTCFGAGLQAGFQLRCLTTVLPVKHVLVVGRAEKRAREFAEAMAGEIGIPVERALSAREAVEKADVVTCATTSPTPVFDGRDLRPGTHVDAVGSFRPETREVDTETVKRARVAVDTYAGAWDEAGDLLIPVGEAAIERDHVGAELAELVTRKKSGRSTPDEITLYKSVGFAFADAATARLAYDRARDAGAGQDVSLE
ncbi:MAG: ornithine cyclodeaminase family protein [Candidatus Methylomirabilia bacterium]